MGSGDDLPAYPTPSQAFQSVPPPRIRKSNTQQSAYSTQSSSHSHNSIPSTNSSDYRRPPGNYRPNGQAGSFPSSVQNINQNMANMNLSTPNNRYQQHQHQHPPPPIPPQQHSQSHYNYQPISPPHQVQHHNSMPQMQQQQPHPAPPPPPMPPQQLQHQAYQQSSNQLLSSIQPHQPQINHQPQTKQQKLELELRELFNTCDVNRSGRLSEIELSNALHNFDHTKFQASTVKLMIRLFDKDRNGTIEFLEFTQLWKYISSYKKLFYQADQDNNKSISFSEYQDILGKIGYHLNTDLVLYLFQRFSTQGLRDSTGGSLVGRDLPNLKFDMFIESLIYLRKLTDVFKKYDSQTSGVAVINFQDFILEVASLQLS